MKTMKVKKVIGYTERKTFNEVFNKELNCLDTKKENEIYEQIDKGN